MNNTTMWKEIFEQPRAISDCLAFNKKTVDELAAKIREFKPSSVIIAARGTSDHVATYAKYLFEIYCHIPVSLAAPSVMTLYSAQVDMSKCLVMGISQSGAAADALEVLESAEKQGALTVSITNNQDSNMAKAARFHLFCDAGLEKSVAATKTFGTQLCLITMLISALSGSAAVTSALDKLRPAVESVLAMSSEIEELAKRYRFMRECFVLARGIIYPIGMETALKIQETCYIRAKAFAISDFQHGPFAMVDSEIPVFLLAVDEHSDQDVQNILNRLKDCGADTLIISNKSSLVGQTSGSAIKVPDWCEGIPGAFAAAVFAQMFACALSVSKGNNPDAPRGLKKVTVTR